MMGGLGVIAQKNINVEEKKLRQQQQITTRKRLYFGIL